MHQRVPLRPLRGSAYGLGQPDAFGTGAFRGRRFRERRDRADAAEAGAGPRVKVFRTGPCARICGWMCDLTPKEGSLAERGCAEVPPTRHVQPWAVPTPTPNAPLRKEVEREAGDPEGNLVIVERVGHESQRHFPYWEHSWAGTARRSASTRNSASGAREHRLIACQRTSVIYSIVPAAMESGGHLHVHCSATVRTPDAISASPQKFSAGGLAHA